VLRRQRSPLAAVLEARHTSVDAVVVPPAPTATVGAVRVNLPVVVLIERREFHPVVVFDALRACLVDADK